MLLQTSIRITSTSITEMSKVGSYTAKYGWAPRYWTNQKALFPTFDQSEAAIAGVHCPELRGGLRHVVRRRRETDVECLLLKREKISVLPVTIIVKLRVISRVQIQG